MPESATRRYSQSGLENLSPEEIRLARNEIYARHGRRFQDDALQSYFQSKTWYEGAVGPDQFADIRLNQIERDNLGLLLCNGRFHGGVCLRGGFEMDTSGLIIGYAEIFMS